MLAVASGQFVYLNWLDLRNAFGSVLHSLIQFALRHYQFPVHYQRLIHAFYNHLLALVDVPEVFQTQPFHFAIGVFRGCTLSLLLSNLVVQLLLDSLEQKAHSTFAYSISSIDESSLLTSAYADDLQLGTRILEENQALLNNTDRFLKWTETMEARPNKCWPVAMKILTHEAPATLMKRQVIIASTRTLQLLDSPCNTLMTVISVTSDAPQMFMVWRSLPAQQLQPNLTNGFNLSTTKLYQNTSKLWLYQHFIIPKLSWYLTALDLTLTFV